MSNRHSGFGKIHEKLFSSSLMREPLETRWTFVYLFTSCGADGVYEGDTFAIARGSNLPEPSVIEAMARLSSDDPLSSSVEFNGRRVEDVSAGHTGSRWLVLNHARYRSGKDPADRSEYNRNYYATTVKPKRAKKSAAKRQHVKNDSGDSGQAEGISKGRGGSGFTPPSLPEVEAFWAEEGLRGKPEKFFNHWEAHAWKGVVFWRPKAREWSSDQWDTPAEKEAAEAKQAASDWGRGRPAEADQALDETCEVEEPQG